MLTILAVVAVVFLIVVVSAAIVAVVEAWMDAPPSADTESQF